MSPGGPPFRVRVLVATVLAAFLLALAPPHPVSAQRDVLVDRPYVGGEIIVRYRADVGRSLQQTIERTMGTTTVGVLAGGSKRLLIVDGSPVRAAAARLRSDPRVEYAVPNYVAKASGFQPNDRGFPRQWNFWGSFGINMPDAWELARRRGAPGGRGAVVAVIDTGVAYRNLGPFRRAPDLRSFARGYDFVERDRLPLDMNGHGTHVAGTIGETTNNRIGAAGIAYRARIMPIRALNRFASGSAAAVASGVRYAVRHGADVINLSLEFPSTVREADIPYLMAALRYARRRRVIVTAVAGNHASPGVLPLPARARGVIGVAATTESGCRALYSSSGADVDVAAPGGGPDAAPSYGDAWELGHCRPGEPRGSIYQQTFSSTPARFAMPSGFYGTSMAAPHVAGLAALLIASGRLGPEPRPAAVERWIEHTAQDIGPPGFDVRYGHGLIDAAAALR